MKISVIITAHKAEAFLSDCVDSLLCQNPHEILIGIDDCPSTYAAARQLSNNIKLFYFEKSGTYKIRNTLSEIATGTHILFFDADDIARTDMLYYLTKSNADYVRYKFYSFSTTIRKADQRLNIHANGTFLIKKTIFIAANGFQGWPCSADAEFHGRLNYKSTNIDMPLFYRRVHPSSLTQNAEYGIGTKGRNKYTNQIGKAKPPKRMSKAKFQEISKKKISFNIATYPPREANLKQVIEAIYPQADVIRVYLNEYDHIPDFLQGNKFEIAIDLKNIKDTGKFYWAETLKNEWYFTIDDDILYPPTYAADMIRGAMTTGATIVTMHGSIFPENPKNIQDRKVNCYFNNQPKNEIVNYAGTGVTMFNNSELTIDRDIFEQDGMTDQYFAVAMQRLKLGIMSLAHTGIKPLSTTESLWDKRNKEYLDKNKKILNSVKWKIYDI